MCPARHSVSLAFEFGLPAPSRIGAFRGYAERRFADSLRDMHAKARVPALAGCGAGHQTVKRIEQPV